MKSLFILLMLSLSFNLNANLVNEMLRILGYSIIYTCAELEQASHQKRKTAAEYNLQIIKIAAFNTTQFNNVYLQSVDFKGFIERSEWHSDIHLGLCGTVETRPVGIFNKAMEETNLRYANLEQMKLCRLNLRKANLSHASLYNAELENCILDEADLSFADLRRAKLKNISLRGAILNNILRYDDPEQNRDFITVYMDISSEKHHNY